MLTVEQAQFMLDVLGSKGLAITIDKCRIAADTLDSLLKIVITKPPELVPTPPEE